MGGNLRIAFAGDRDIAVWVLNYLLDQEVTPKAILVSASEQASHADALRELVSDLPEDRILVGGAFRSEEGKKLLRTLDLDYIIGIHFPYLMPSSVLSIPKVGVLNLHPAFLPYNRGWHTPSWAILEDTPVGATLHFMDAGIDTGDIIHQKRVEVGPGETAHSLYQKLKQCELETFIESWPKIERGTYQRQPQLPESGTAHKKLDLLTPDVQMLDLKKQMSVGDLLRKLRALTTNDIFESAFFEEDGKRFHVQVVIQEENL